jgi:hypothetical protein
MKQRQAERRRLAGSLKIWRAQRAEPEGNGMDLSRCREERLELVIVEDVRLELILPGAQPGEVVARLSGALAAASFADETLEQSEFHVEPVIGHYLAYESGGEMRGAAALTLCANDLLEIDGQWPLTVLRKRSIRAPPLHVRSAN